MLPVSLKRLINCLVFLLLIICSPLSAQPNTSTADYPTLAALETAVIPPRDRVELAQRLLGVTNLPVTPTSAPDRHVGDQEVFYVTNSAQGSTFQITATLQAVGEHIYLWVENGAAFSESDLEALASAFDERVYPNVRSLWGSEASPGVDGDPRIYGLFASGLGASSVAYFSSDNTYPVAAVPTSNAHEMFFFNLDTLTGGYALPLVESVLAHEFQHMIRNNLHNNLDLWMNEGLSEFTQAYLYNDLGGAALSFLGRPDTQLNSWAEPQNERIYNYGASALFLAYFYDRYGLDAIGALSADRAPHALEGLDNVLGALGEPGADEFFADWVMANLLLDPTMDDGTYGYQRLSLNASITPEQTATSYPFEAADSVHQYGTDYIALENLEGIQRLNVRVTAPAETGLIDSTGQRGRFWYSNRADVSDSTLTRAFDLSGVTSATLNYRLWYHTENLWDFGYVMVSDDGGASWDMLQTPQTTGENPLGTAYGVGYSGISGGGETPVWTDESLSLDAYAGEEILLRFEMITDDGVNQPGMAIDDVTIPELNYASDFESDDGGWEAAGWLLTDNRLPQEMWVQVAELGGAETMVTRWRAQGNGDWTLELTPGTQQAVVVLSAFAPVTTIPMPYILSVSRG
jgi:immune inhibitor A